MCLSPPQVGGIVDIVTPDVGDLIPPGDPHVLARR
jgi:hypothetical protein